MRILLLTLGLLFGIFGGQQSSAQLINKEKDKDQIIGELTWNTWNKMPDSLKVQGLSRGFNLYLHLDVPMAGKFSFAPGIGIGTSSIFTDYFFGVERFDSATLGNTTFSDIPDSLNHKKHKITLASIDVPLELRFRSDFNKWKIGIGVLGGFVFHNHTKYVGDHPSIDDEELKVKEFNLPNITQFRYGLRGRLGYGLVSLVTYYGLNSVFEEGKTNGVSPQEFSIGISINGF